jgi:hypothetical protein
MATSPFLHALSHVPSAGLPLNRCDWTAWLWQVPFNGSRDPRHQERYYNLFRCRYVCCVALDSDPAALRHSSFSTPRVVPLYGAHPAISSKFRQGGAFQGSTENAVVAACSNRADI